MKNFTHEFCHFMSLFEANEKLAEKEERALKSFLLELEIATDGYLDLHRFFQNQAKRWNDQAETLCIFRDRVKEKMRKIYGE